MPLELETIPPDATKLVEAYYDLFGECTNVNETLYCTNDNRYFIDYGLEIIEQSIEDVIQWLEETINLASYRCYNGTDIRVLLDYLQA